MLDSLKLKFFWITLERFPNMFRPSSKPYITGDTVRNYCDYIFDECNTFNPLKIQNGDKIFLNTDFLEIYFKIIHPKIENKYFLFTHNSDISIDESVFKKYYDENIIHWFAQNLITKENEKISLIPIGLENLRRLKHGRKKWFKDYPKLKRYNILSAYNEFTNYKKRGAIQNIIQNHDIIDFRNFTSTAEYFNELKKYKFVLCPEGNGPDTHRVWESINLKVIPIMLKGDFSKNLQNNNVPGYYINHWEDLNHLKKVELDSIYSEILETSNFQTSHFNYWKNKFAEFDSKI
jgi:hypothetical protein